MGRMIFCSTIIPTVGRESLARAVESVLHQDLSEVDFELLVVNDSGKPLEHAKWQRSEKVRIINTYKHERSVARNTGASIARGNYLHFLDDDDWLLPGAFQQFHELSQKSGVKWLYGITQLLDRYHNPTIQLRHNLNGNCFLQAMAGEWIPLQSSFIERKAFFRTGGFNPLLAGPEDIDFQRRFFLEEDAAETPNIVACVVIGEEGSTTDYIRHSSVSRQAREFILEMPNAYSRMLPSAKGPTWHGRMMRIYLTSTAWNLKHRQFLKAASRGITSAGCCLIAGRSLFSTQYWKAVSKPYASTTFERGIRDAYQER